MSAPQSHDPLVVTTKDGVTWVRRAVTQDGHGLYAVTDSCTCPEYLMASLAELAEHGIAGSAHALPVPVGPQMPEFPPPPETELEKLRAERARLQGLLAEAVADVHRARRDRDLMRERVSEPFGCKHCGEAKRSHGRRWITGAGVHAWERPSDEQVKARMQSRRSANLASQHERFKAGLRRADEVNNELMAEVQRYAEGSERPVLWSVYNEMHLRAANAEGETSRLRARVAELEAAAKAIRHLHTDSPMGPCPVCVDADAMGRGEDYTVPFPCPTARLAGAKDCDPPYVSRLLPPRDAVCAGCGHSGAEHHHGDTKCWAHLPKQHGDPITICGCAGFVAGPDVEVSADRLTQIFAPSQALREDPHDGPLSHPYRVGRDLPETGGGS